MDAVSRLFIDVDVAICYIITKLTCATNPEGRAGNFIVVHGRSVT